MFSDGILLCFYLPYSQALQARLYVFGLFEGGFHKLLDKSLPLFKVTMLRDRPFILHLVVSDDTTTLIASFLLLQ